MKDKLTTLEQAILEQARKEVQLIPLKSSNVIYSALFGTIDKSSCFIENLGESLSDCDFILFTDSDEENHKGIENFHIIKLDACLNNHRLSAKLFKILPHYFLNDYKGSLWIDANMAINGFTLPFNLLSTNSLVMIEHNKREYVYQEVIECLFKGKEAWGALIRQLITYYMQGFYKQNKLMQCRWLMRDHNNESVKVLMDFWWLNIKKYSIRDQISFPYCMWKKGSAIRIFHPSEKELFKVKQHSSRLIRGSGLIPLFISSMWVVVNYLRHK